MLRLLGDSSTSAASADADAGKRAEVDPLASLVAATVAGDRAAERTLLVAVTPAFLGIARRVFGAHSAELEDVCQEAALAFLSALPGFRGECSVAHFASRVALLTALATRRRRSAQKRDSERAGSEVPDEPQSPAEQIDSVRRRRALLALLDDLPLAQAEVLGLHVVLGHTVEETSGMIGVPVNTVRSRLRRSLAALRERLAHNRRLFEVVGGKS